MKRSLNFSGRAGSHLTKANLADLMRRYVQPTCQHEWEAPKDSDKAQVCAKCGFVQAATGNTTK